MYGNNLLTKDDVRQVKCPTCGAGKGEPCKHDPPKESNHMARVKAARASKR